MITKTHFEHKLCEYAGLVFLSKKQTDLFLLLQTNTVTYHQLALSGLHGASHASARRALKRLETDGYVQAKTIPKHNSEKYYSLTPSGRNMVFSSFPESFTERMKVNWSRHPPAGSQQILHRIRTNDFYFSYLSDRGSVPRIWCLEHPLPIESSCKNAPARCDALFLGNKRPYYIEQDNSTQSVAVIHKKISQYAEAGLFTPAQGQPSLLVFCLSFPSHVRPAGAAPYSAYRLILKFCKLWRLLEDQHGIMLDCRQFYNALAASPLRSTVSSTELQRFLLFCKANPEADALPSMIQLKRLYLARSQDSSLCAGELDALYRKRLRSHFTALYGDFPILLQSARCGTPLFAVPNHRLQVFLPFILPEELSLQAKLQMYLLKNGLILDDWAYSSPLKIADGASGSHSFFAGLQHPAFGSLAVEVPYHDLSALPRMEFALKKLPATNRFILICFVLPSLLDDFRTLCIKNGWERRHIILAADLLHVFGNSGSQDTLFQISHDGEMFPISFECDVFGSKLHTIRKGDNNVFPQH